MKGQTIIQNMEAAQLVNSAIQLSRSNENTSFQSLVIPDLGFGQGSFITDELAEMFFETIKNWRVKNHRSEKLTLDVLQKWARYFKKEIPDATDLIMINFKDHDIEWDHEEGRFEIYGGKTELNDDEISAIVDVFGIGRGRLSRSKIYNAETEGLKYCSYRLIYREKNAKAIADLIEKEKGYKAEDAIDMDSVFVAGGTEELSEEELKIIAASFYVTDYEIEPWHKPDGTWSYELYYGPRFVQYKGPNMMLQA